MNKLSDKISVFLVFIYVIIGFISPSNAKNNQAKEINMAPHKALYSINLTTKKSSVDIINITGKMFYELTKSCDTWVTDHKYDMLYEFAQGHSVRTTSDFSTYESFDGKSFNYTLKRKRDGILSEEIRGSANKEEATYSIPEGLVFKLSKETLFPVSHTLAVLNKIKSGDKFYNATIFDGSDEKGSVDINSLILSKAPDYTPDTSIIHKELLESQGWNIRLAFFPLESFEEASDYEMSVIIHENGVVRHMNVDYNDFSVTHKLIAIEPLENECLTDINKK